MKFSIALAFLVVVACQNEEAVLLPKSNSTVIADVQDY
jgi:hypothetical protein